MLKLCLLMVVLLRAGGVARADGRMDFTNPLHTQDASSDGGLLRQDMNFSDYIWNGAVDLLKQAWITTFIVGVANGTMDPNFYGNYILQNAIYCRKVAQLWVRLANNASVDDEVREYASQVDSEFQECSTELFNEWNIKDDGAHDYGVMVRKPIMHYVTLIKDTMLASPPNMLITTYAHLKLWDTLIDDLLPIIENATINPYVVWVYKYHGSGSKARSQAAQMDQWDKQYQWYDWRHAHSLFRIAIQNEINFFDHGGNSSTSSAQQSTHNTQNISYFKNMFKVS